METQNQLTIVIGVPIKKEAKEKAAEVIGLDLQSSKVLDDTDFPNFASAKGVVRGIVQNLHEEKVVLFTNSDEAITWINNSIILGDTGNLEVAEEVNLLPLQGKLVSLYEYEVVSGTATEVELGEFGFDPQSINDTMNDLFECTIKVQSLKQV